MRKFLAILLAVAMITALFTVGSPVSAEGPTIYSVVPSGNFDYDLSQLSLLYSESLDSVTLTEVIDVYQSDEELRDRYADSPDEVIDFVAEGLHNLSDLMAMPEQQSTGIMPRGGSYPSYYTTVTPVRQAEWYWCGPAAGVQALTGVGIYAHNLSDYSGAQQEMANLMNPNTSTGTSPDKLCNALNVKIKAYKGVSAAKYKYTVVPSTMTKYNLLNNLIGESIRQDRPPVATVLLPTLPYYTGTGTGGHYITIRSIHGESGTAQIVDPHYNSAFFGNHTIYYNDLREMLDGRYIIYSSSYA